jgi:hypothetical protein
MHAAAAAGGEKNLRLKIRTKATLKTSCSLHAASKAFPFPASGDGLRGKQYRILAADAALDTHTHTRRRASCRCRPCWLAHAG